MDLTPQLSEQLKRLRLSGMLETLDVRIQQALEQGLSYPEFLLVVTQDEVSRREQKKLTTRLRRATFTGEKTLEGFNFDARPTLNRQWLLELSSCMFIEEKCNVLLVGPSGVGKSHLAQALGHTACRRGFDVLYIGLNKLIKHLAAGRADGTYDRRFTNLCRVDLLVVDDFGLKALRPPADEDFHELVAERYERGSMIITSNLDFGEWGQAFANPLLASATIDRLRHNAHCLVIEGESYRSPRTMQAPPRRVRTSLSTARNAPGISPRDEKAAENE
jgi:DNA replication protein DnaC